MAPPDAHVVGKIDQVPIPLLDGTLQLANTGTTSSLRITGASASKVDAALTCSRSRRHPLGFLPVALNPAPNNTYAINQLLNNRQAPARLKVDSVPFPPDYIKYRRHLSNPTTHRRLPPLHTFHLTLHTFPEIHRIANMHHSPTNSRSSRDSPLRVEVVNPLMPPWDLWLSSFTVNQLRPYGQIPETESFSRRNSLEVYNTVSLSRMFIDIDITNMGLKARTEVVQMLFDPPFEIGGKIVPITIPAWWWGTQRLTADDVRAALRGEAEARLQGRPLEGIFLRKYIEELRTELDHCARTLPATLFAPAMDDDPEYDTAPLSVTHNEWQVTRNIISDVTVRMTFHRRDVTLEVSLPLTVLHQSPGAAQDWILLQVSL